MASVVFEGVSVAYSGKDILHDVSFTLDSGCYCLLGQNGAGKTTLFRTAIGALSPRLGTVSLMGLRLDKHSQRESLLGYLPHRSALYPSLSVLDNLRYWAWALIPDKRIRKSRIEWAIEKLDLGAIISQECGTLSRGQAQRLAVARTLLSRPKILFLDEPTNSIDPLSARYIRNILTSDDLDVTTIVYSTHNLFEARELASHVILMRQGQVEGVGTVTDILKSNSINRQLIVHADTDPTSVLGGRIISITREGDRYRLTIPEETNPGDIVSLLVSKGIKVHEFREDNSLEALFDHLGTKHAKH